MPRQYTWNCKTQKAQHRTLKFRCRKAAKRGFDGVSLGGLLIVVFCAQLLQSKGPFRTSHWFLARFQKPVQTGLNVLLARGMPTFAVYHASVLQFRAQSIKIEYGDGKMVTAQRRPKPLINCVGNHGWIANLVMYLRDHGRRQFRLALNNRYALPRPPYQRIKMQRQAFCKNQMPGCLIKPHLLLN